MKTIATTAALLPLALVASGASFEAQALPCGGFSFTGGAHPAGDQAHQASLCLGWLEEDLETLASGASVPQIAVGAVTLDVNLVDALGRPLADDASIFSSAAFDVPQVMFRNALLNRSALSGAIGRIEFVFTPAVESFGAWMFDDYGSDDAVSLEILEVDGTLRVEGPLHLASGTGMEGFIGFRSCVGIERVRVGIESSFLELDHLQVGGPIAASQAVVRNGSGTNPVLYSAQRPALGDSWTATVDASAQPGATRTIIVGYDLPLAGAPSPYGEILVDAASRRVFQSYAGVSEGLSVHACRIPADPCLAGLVIHSQAIVIGRRARLCNAVDLTIGRPTEPKRPVTPSR